ncbi:DnaJ domain-containing protein [Pelagibacterium halotolerans]|uniref:DnaJ domain-containing protein n=1 Tax=Pelagibacterium halotolerans TaxID=531813 RepID=UPI0038503BC9
MIWLVAALAIALGLLYLYSLYTQNRMRELVRALRWAVGGVLLAIGALFGLRGNVFVAGLLGAAGVGVLARGRLGPIDFGAGRASPNNASSVKSRYFAMRLDHDTGAVTGEVREGLFGGRDLADLSAEECWALYDEVDGDPDSVALFESWLDANRAGWREYFAEHFGMDSTRAQDDAEPHSGSGLSGVEEAYEILGLSPGATPAEIRSAHRTLMKKVHPDAGGSAFLAARINEAKDVLLKHADKNA